MSIGTGVAPVGSVWHLYFEVNSLPSYSGQNTKEGQLPGLSTSSNVGSPTPILGGGGSHVSGIKGFINKSLTLNLSLQISLQSFSSFGVTSSSNSIEISDLSLSMYDCSV